MVNYITSPTRELRERARELRAREVRLREERQRLEQVIRHRLYVKLKDTPHP